jgi:hypothetical protein
MVGITAPKRQQQERRNDMKKIAVRRAGSVRLTALCKDPYSAFNF